MALLAVVAHGLPSANATVVEAWTFCVAEVGDGAEIWISQVFAAEGSRERLEADFTAYLNSRGLQRVLAQCPQPKRDKRGMMNARLTAAAFHRRLVEAPEAEFPPR